MMGGKTEVNVNRKRHKEMLQLSYFHFFFLSRTFLHALMQTESHTKTTKFLDENQATLEKIHQTGIIQLRIDSMCVK